MTVLAADLAPLEAWLSRNFDAALRIADTQLLSGGAIQQNWLLRLEGNGPAEVVLRRDAAASLAESHGRAAEFSLLRAALQAGVTVPEPLALCENPETLGRPFLVMAKAPGVAFGPRVVKDFSLATDRASLAARLGAELAKLHRIVPPRADLDFLGAPPTQPAQVEVDRVRAALDALGADRPGLEWALRWAERHAPPCPRVVLTHRDFRTGNYLVDAGGLTAILDWEFASWGDPMADLGWFCAACWRFARPDLEAGGIAPRAEFYAGYAAASGAPVDDDAVRYWEVVAHLRWAAIALGQGWRHGSGAEPSLELALTGRLAAELELAALRATAPERWQGARTAPDITPSAAAASPPPDRDLHPETTGSALLDAAQRMLDERVLPTLSGDARYAALMVGSAIRMAAREIEQRARLVLSGQQVRASGEQLRQAIRDGRHDADARLHAALWQDAAVRVSLSKPSALARAERRLAGLPDLEPPGTTP